MIFFFKRIHVLIFAAALRDRALSSLNKEGTSETGKASGTPVKRAKWHLGKPSFVFSLTF